MTRRVSIGTVLLLMNLILLVLPVGGLWMLRLYESALVRQTETELIAQGATVAAVYRDLWRRAGGDPAAAGPPVDPRWTRRPGFDQPWLPRTAMLDLASDPVLPATPDGDGAAGPPDPAAGRGGNTLDPILREVQRETLAGIRVVDRSGIVVATTGEELGLSLAAREEVARALAGEPVSVLRRRGKGPAPSALSLFGHGSAARVVTALPVIEGERVIGVVVAARTPSTVDEALAGKLWPLAGLLALLLAAAAFLSAIGMAVIGRPLREVTRRAQRTAAGERGAMAAPAPAVLREVAELSQALSRMATTLEQRADYIRDFAAHVSHEFKTPLATIGGTVELLRDHLGDMSAAEWDRFLANLESEARRLARLVQRLLELARADVAAASPSGLCRPAAIIASLGEGTDMVAADLVVRMDAEAFEAVLGNLLDNARRHGCPDGRVALSLRAEGGDAVLTVADDGPGISPGNAERIFTPFFTTARRQGGTGLGLAIVRSLVTAHGGTIALLPSQRGAVFELRLPLAD